MKYEKKYRSATGATWEVNLGLYGVHLNQQRIHDHMQKSYAAGIP